ncbi:hypothetical protein PRIPAC_85901, partial [Pristionchus pacificus]|uniref:Uncharacterized protein n=1 Tax=Pristionchus pacificus TaxID=54126 RepID=A0A2A6BLJ5_PRIPA
EEEEEEETARGNSEDGQATLCPSRRSCTTSWWKPWSLPIRLLTARRRRSTWRGMDSPSSINTTLFPRDRLPALRRSRSRTITSWMMRRMTMRSRDLRPLQGDDPDPVPRRPRANPSSSSTATSSTRLTPPLPHLLSYLFSQFLSHPSMIYLLPSIYRILANM